MPTSAKSVLKVCALIRKKDDDIISGRKNEHFKIICTWLNEKLFYKLALTERKKERERERV